MSYSIAGELDKTKVFLSNWSELEGRWDPNYYRGIQEFRRRLKNCPFPIEPLKESLEQVQYGISKRATKDRVGAPMLRMINLQDDAWDLSDLKYIQMPEEELKPYFLKPGDILFNRTNSKELVGKCCVFNLTGDYVFASYLIRVRVKDGTLLPDFVVAFLSSGLGRIQINAVSRQIAGMTNINAEEIRNLSVPILDDKSQRNVVSAWRSAIQRRDRTLEMAREVIASIDDLLLSELGVPNPSEPPNTLESRIFQSTFAATTGQRWDPLYYQSDIFHFVRSANCDLKRLGDLGTEFLTGFAAGRKDQVDEDEHGIIQIRPTNLSDDRDFIFDRNVYIDASELDARKQDILSRNDVLFNNTNSQEQVGKTVLFDLDGNFFCSNHITRVQAKATFLDAAYLTYLLNLYQRRKVFFRLCTNWNNQSGVGSDVLARMPIPVPKLKHQHEIVERLDSVRTQAQSLRTQAQSQLDQAKGEVEAMILGKKPTE